VQLGVGGVSADNGADCMRRGHRILQLTGFSQVAHPEIAAKHASPRGRALDCRAVKRVATILLSIWALMLVAAPAAFAENGVGLAGPTTDKTVTFFCFGVIGFFAILPIVLSLIQGRLEKRKEARKADLSRFS
jgi:hypothetical protein